MNKKQYINPVLRIVEFEVKGAMLLALSCEEITSGGSAEENGIFEAEINENLNWELW